jgi:hypothetical protein
MTSMRLPEKFRGLVSNQVTHFPAKPIYLETVGNADSLVLQTDHAFFDAIGQWQHRGFLTRVLPKSAVVYVMFMEASEKLFVKVGYKNIEDTDEYADELVGYIEKKAKDLTEWYQQPGAGIFIFFPPRVFSEEPEPGKAAEGALIYALLQNSGLDVQHSDEHMSTETWSTSLEYMFLSSDVPEISVNQALKSQLREFSGHAGLEPCVVHLATAGGSDRKGRKRIMQNGERVTCKRLRRRSTGS